MADRLGRLERKLDALCEALAEEQGEADPKPAASLDGQRTSLRPERRGHL